jgi:glycosyltransferase involved in cell wall biosynthesis
MKKVNILHLDSEKSWRGGQQQAIYLFEYLLKQGIRTEFICRKQSHLEEYLSKHNLPYKSLPLVSELDIVSAYRIAKYAKKNDFSILHLHAAHAVTIGLIAKLFYPELKLIAVRRVDFTIKKNILSSFKYKTRRLDKIVAISENIKKVLISDGIEESKIEMIRSGIDLLKYSHVIKNNELRFSLNIPHDAVLIGTIAALAGHKDYPNLLKAAEIVIRESENIYFIAVGEGSKKAEIHAFANSLILKERFIFLGYRKDIGEILNSLDVFVLASKLEGLGTSVLDAMAVGLPIIGTDAGGIPEMVENDDNGLIVPKGNSESLAKAILCLAQDKEKQISFSEKSLQKVKQFSKDYTAQKNIELYEKLS